MWLEQSPEHFYNLEEMMEKVHESKRNDVFNHFTYESYFYEGEKRWLRPNGVFFSTFRFHFTWK